MGGRGSFLLHCSDSATGNDHAERGLWERAIWKDVFAHYVFDYDEAEVAGHIPEPARRALGPMDEARVRHLRALLLKRLDR